MQTTIFAEDNGSVRQTVKLRDQFVKGSGLKLVIKACEERGSSSPAIDWHPSH